MKKKSILIWTAAFCMLPSLLFARTTRTRTCTGTLYLGFTLKIGNQTRNYSNLRIKASALKARLHVKKSFRSTPTDLLVGDTGAMEVKRLAREAILRCYQSALKKRNPGVHKHCKNSYPCNNRLYPGQKCVERNSSRNHINKQMEEFIVPSSRVTLLQSIKKTVCRIASREKKKRRIQGKGSEVESLWVRTKIVCPGRTVLWNVPLSRHARRKFRCKKHK